MADPMSEIHDQLEGMKQDLNNLRAETMGDCNQIGAFKRTLRGRIEVLEKSAEKLVTQTEHSELKKAVEGLSGMVKRATDALNFAIKAIVAAGLGGLGCGFSTA